LRSASDKAKADDLARRISSTGNVDQSKNCKACGIRRGIRVCQECGAKEAPKGLRARKHAEHVSNNAHGMGKSGGSVFTAGGAGRRGSTFPSVPQFQQETSQGQSQFQHQLQHQPQPQRRFEEAGSTSPLHHPRLGPDTTITSRYSMEALYPVAAEHGDVIFGENELVALPPKDSP